jgi:FkbM family methyltransferase
MRKSPNPMEATISMNGMRFSFVNEKEFFSLYDEIFNAENYKFSASTSSPFILDCGANIGISVLYFKSQYPNAKIVAFEPHPDTFRMLTTNVRQNHLKDVTLVNAALSANYGEMDFYVSRDTVSPTNAFCTGIQGSWYGQGEYRTIKVPTVRLSSYITRNIDLLKVDIEGMEEVVLKDIEGQLRAIEAIKMEYHHISSARVNDLDVILALLKDGGFDYVLEHDNKVINLSQVYQIDTSAPFLLMITAQRKEDTTPSVEQSLIM